MVFSRIFRFKSSKFPLLPPYGTQNPHDGRIIPSHPDGLTPYLGLKSRLSQVWINPWTFLILLILIRVLLAIGDILSDVAIAKTSALSACSAVESAGNDLASMPYYMAEGLNNVVSLDLSKMVDNVSMYVDFILKIIEEIVLDFLGMLFPTFECLAHASISGLENLTSAAITDVVDEVKNHIRSTEDDLDSEFSSYYNSVADTLSKTNIGTDVLPSTPNYKRTISELSGNLTSITANLQSNITTLVCNGTNITTDSAAWNSTKAKFMASFDAISKEWNRTYYDGYTIKASSLYSPQESDLKLCGSNDGITKFFNGVTSAIKTARTGIIVGLAIAAALACIICAWREIRRWRQMQERTQLVRKEADDPLDIFYLISRPTTSALGIKAASKFSNSRRQILVRWIVAYATSMPALFVLALGVIALLSCFFQWIILHQISREVPALTDKVNDYTNDVVGFLDNQSAIWANKTDQLTSGLSDGLLQMILNFVDNTTDYLSTGVNTTVTALEDEITKEIKSKVAQEIVEDIIELALGLLVLILAKKFKFLKKELEKFAKEYLKDQMPHNYPQKVFALRANSTSGTGSTDSVSSFLTKAGNSASQKIADAVNTAIDALKAALHKELIFAAAILGIWLLIVLMGLARALSLWWGRSKNRGEGGGHAIDPVPHNPPPPPRTDANGFTDIPLTSVPRAMSSSGRGSVAPPYEATPARAVVLQNNNPFHDSYAISDEKRGFAGQRTAQHVHVPLSQRKSNCVEYDMKG